MNQQELRVNSPKLTQFRELVAVVSNEEEATKRRFLRGVKILRALKNPEHDFSKGLPENFSYQDILNFLVHPTAPYNCILDILKSGVEYINKYVAVEREEGMDEAQYQQSIQAKRNEYIVSLRELVEVARPLADSNITNSIIRRNKPEISMLPGEVRVETFQLHDDKLLLSWPSTMDKEKVEEAIQEIKKIWYLIRAGKPTKNQTLSFVLTDSDASKNLRSYAVMQENPIAVVNIAQPDYVDVIHHETVHAVFGAEAGSPVSIDFVEGVAMLFEFSFNQERAQKKVANLVQSFKWFFGSASAVPNETIQSSTQMLDKAFPDGKANQNAKEASYLFGYCFIKSLVRTERYRELTSQYKAEGKPLYTLLIEMNKELAWSANSNLEIAKKIGADGQVSYDYSNRNLLNGILDRFGFDPNEVFSNASFYVQRILSGNVL